MFKLIRLLNYYSRINLLLSIKIKVNTSKGLKGLIIALRVKPYTWKKFNSFKDKIKEKKELYL
jgi:hypothetical protein